MSHFLAFASRVMTSSLSTSSTLESFAIFSIASRKRVSTLRVQGGLQGHQGFQGWNWYGLSDISFYYRFKSYLCMAFSFS